MPELQSLRFSSKKLKGAILLLLALTFLTSPASSDQAWGASFHKCGSIPALTSWSIEAKRVRCHRARKVVRAYVSAAIKDGDWTRNILGFHCKLVGTYGDGGNYRCAAPGSQVIRFSRGG